MLNSIKLTFEKSIFKHNLKLILKTYNKTFCSTNSNLNTGNEVDSEDKKEETIEEIRARIFGYHIGNGLRSGRKILKKSNIGSKIASYYLKPIKDPLMLDLKQEKANLKLDSLRRRGKGPPKKGKGKRSATKKSKK